jgi:hypothetical protein
MVRRRNLNLDLQIDRIRKHLDYLRKERPTISKVLSRVIEEFSELKKLYALRNMVEKGVMSAKAEKQYLHQKALMDTTAFKLSFVTKKWLESELVALP